MSVYAEINKNPTTADRLKLAATFLVGLGAMGAFQFFLRHREQLAQGLWITAAILAALCLVRPLGRLLYVGWMGLGVTIGIFTQPIVLAVAYVVLFVPLGFVFRALGRDMMKRTRDKAAKSYWQEVDDTRDPADYFKQY